MGNNAARVAVLNDLGAYFFIVLGILLSVAVPIAIRTFKEQGARAEAGQTTLQKLAAWFVDVVKPYLGYVVASLVLGVLVYASLRSNGVRVKEWYSALMAGYMWDSTVQKIKEGLS